MKHRNSKGTKTRIEGKHAVIKETVQEVTVKMSKVYFSGAGVGVKKCLNRTLLIQFTKHLALKVVAVLF